eukprot:g10539.t1
MSAVRVHQYAGSTPDTGAPAINSAPSPPKKRVSFAPAPQLFAKYSGYWIACLLLSVCLAVLGVLIYSWTNQATPTFPELEVANQLGVSYQQLQQLYQSLSCSAQGDCMQSESVIPYLSPDYQDIIHVAYLLPDWQIFRPTLVVRPANVADVQAVVVWARRYNISLTPAAGTHGSLGYCYAGRIGLDLRRLSTVSVSSTPDGHNTLTVGGGTRFQQITDVLQKLSLAAATGVCNSVGLAGWTLGGGYSPFSKALGLGVDVVKSFEVVLADGQVVQANATGPFSDLFWALRGGGHQSFGIVTALSVRAVPFQSMPYVSLTIPLEKNPDLAAKVLQRWHELYLQNATGWAETGLMTYSVRAGREFSPESPLVLGFEFVLVASESELDATGSLQPAGNTGTLHTLLQPLLEAIGDQLIQIGVRQAVLSDIYDYDATFVQGVDTNYSTVQATIDGLSPIYESKLGMYLKRDGLASLRNCRQLVDAVLSYLELEQSQQFYGTNAFRGLYMVLEPYTGAMLKPEANTTAFVHRPATDGDLYVDVFTASDLPEWQAQQAYNAASEWLENLYFPYNDTNTGMPQPARLAGLLKRQAQTGQPVELYQNYAWARAGAGSPAERWPALQMYHGENLCRLVQIKAKYDSDMFFDFPQGVPASVPAGASCTPQD